MHLLGVYEATVSVTPGDAAFLFGRHTVATVAYRAATVLTLTATPKRPARPMYKQDKPLHRQLQGLPEAARRELGDMLHAFNDACENGGPAAEADIAARLGVLGDFLEEYGLDRGAVNRLRIDSTYETTVRYFQATAAVGQALRVCGEAKIIIDVLPKAGFRVREYDRERLYSYDDWAMHAQGNSPTESWADAQWRYQLVRAGKIDPGVLPAAAD